MKTIFTIFTILLLFNSCQRPTYNIFKGDTKYITSFPKTDSLKGDTIIINSFGANTIHIVDSFMVFVGSRLDTFYKVCSKNNYEFLGSYVPKGRGDSELSDITFPIFCKTESDGAKIYLQDRGSSTIKIFNITQSVKSQRTIFDEERINIKSFPGFKALYPINDTLFFTHYFDYKEDKECYSLLNSNTNIPLYIDTIYTEKLSSRGNIFLWNTFNCLNPNKQKYATAMQFFNQINIYEIDKRKALTIIPQGESSHLEEVETTLMPEKMEYYEDLISTENQIWALYANQNRKDWATKENISTEIHILDWDGNPQHKLILPQKINKIALDEEQKILYGMTSSEQVFKYNLDHIL